jgi:hypothetical protein
MFRDRTSRKPHDSPRLSDGSDAMSPGSNHTCVCSKAASGPPVPATAVDVPAVLLATITASRLGDR